MKKITLLLLFPLFILASCGKYEEGPNLSLRSKKARLTGYWVAEKTYINGKEQSNSSGYYDIQKDGDFGKDGGSGTWKFSDDKMNVIFTNTNVLFTSTSEVKILRLTNQEWWTEATILGQLYEVHYKKADKE